MTMIPRIAIAVRNEKVIIVSPFCDLNEPPSFSPRCGAQPRLNSILLPPAGKLLLRTPLLTDLLGALAGGLIDQKIVSRGTGLDRSR
jgi:hypothetical protein